MLNKQITEGRLTANPELKMTPSAVSVCRFTLASDDEVKKADGSKDTDWVDCVAWRQTAEFVAKYLTKGRLVIVEGRPKKRSWTDKDGIKRSVTEIRVEKIYFAESKGDNTNSQNGGQDFAAPAAAGDFVEISGDEDLPF
jgi:single-strand DNA-binding protein